MEVKRFAARRRKEDRIAEERFERLNGQLMDMIEMGKQALGSTVEIVEDEDGPGPGMW